MFSNDSKPNGQHRKDVDMSNMTKNFPSFGLFTPFEIGIEKLLYFMKTNYKTILIGNSGFLGRCFLSSDNSILSVGRTKLSNDYKNDHLHINDFYRLFTIR